MGVSVAALSPARAKKTGAASQRDEASNRVSPKPEPARNLLSALPANPASIPVDPSPRSHPNVRPLGRTISPLRGELATLSENDPFESEAFVEERPTRRLSTPADPPPPLSKHLNSDWISRNELRPALDSPPLRGFLQAKLEIGAVDDPLEREADAVADAVMRMPDPTLSLSASQPQIRRKCAECEEEDKKKLQMKPAADAVMRMPDPTLSLSAGQPQVRRKCAECEEEDKKKLQMKPAAAPPGSAVAAAPQIVHEVLREPARSLDVTPRLSMERSFGVDLRSVRVHSGAKASESAASVNALAYTVGSDIVFGSGQYAPERDRGRRLLAHELTHVVQQTGRRSRDLLARQPTQPQSACQTGHPPGTLVKQSSEADPNEIVYLIWGTWRNGDTVDGWVRRTTSDWIRWRFGGITAEQFHDVFNYMMSIREPVSDVPPVVAGCQYTSSINRVGMANIRRLSGEATREHQAKKKSEESTDTNAPQGAESGTLSEHKGEGGEGAVETSEQNKGQGAGGTGAETKSEPSDKDKQPSDQPGIGVDLGGEKSEAKQRATPVQADLTVLKDTDAANLLLKFLEHFTGRPITDEDRSAAAKGFDQAQLDKIIDGKPMRRALAAFFTQGDVEFHAAGGADLHQFTLLEQTICEQLTWGNPTATGNQLKIGKGHPENDVLGIIDRGTGMLLYDATGIALPGISGIGFRDKGYVATKPKWGMFNLANVKDEGLRSFLNSLRQTFREPAAMAVAGAEVYFNNIKLVNSRVVDGLAEAIKEKFIDMLPVFIGFIAGRAVLAFLSKFPEPPVAAVATALEALLTAAEYVMDIEFGAGALERLVLAAGHLSHFEKNDKDEMTALSEEHLNAAAKIIQDMVAEIAVLFATMALGKLIQSVHKGGAKLNIECTHCDLKGPGAEEAKGVEAGRKVDEGVKTAGDASGDEQTKDEAQRRTRPRQSAARARAKSELQELQVRKTKTAAKIDELEGRLSEATNKVNGLKAEVQSLPRGSAERAAALSKFKEAQQALSDLEAEDELGGYREERRRQDEAEQRILESLELKRPAIRQTTKDAIKAAAKKNAAGQYLDANTGEVIEGEPVYGHKYGREHRRLVLEATEKGMDQETFNDWVNDHPDWFQLETEANNASHRFEKPGVD
jgi:Domain of unknown function (DUF4157)/HNH/ENDO VII superfamily nuclease with conserved GHE residues